MGEIADMMLDGTLCEGCGVVMDDMIPDGDDDAGAEPPGYSRLYAGCRSGGGGQERGRSERKAGRRGRHKRRQKLP